MVAGINVKSAKAVGGCGPDVSAHAAGFIPNCSNGGPPGIHRFRERYCARKTEISPDGEPFCPPNNNWISKAEAYAKAGYIRERSFIEAARPLERSHAGPLHEHEQVTLQSTLGLTRQAATAPVPSIYPVSPVRVLDRTRVKVPRNQTQILTLPLRSSPSQS